MIAGALLSGIAWLVVGLTGAPVDPFLPLVAALCLHRPWPPLARIGAAVALGPIAAAAAGDVALERTGLYAAAALLAIAAGSSLRDGVVTRTGLVAATFATVLGVRLLLATGGATPGPGQTAVAVAATVLWTALHASLVFGLERARTRLSTARAA